jgi:hypothetical protein
VKAPLVHQREDGIQDRGIRFEDLVEERDVRFGQLSGRDAPVLVGFERLQADRAEDLLGRGELGEEPLKVERSLHAPAELVGEHRFRGARRTDEQDVGAGDERDQRPLDHVAALGERLLELVADASENLDRSHHGMTRRLTRRGRCLRPA